MLHIQDSPYIQNIHYENAKDFIRAISYDGELYELFNEHHIFRGHSTDQYEQNIWDTMHLHFFLDTMV